MTIDWINQMVDDYLIVLILWNMTRCITECGTTHMF